MFKKDRFYKRWNTMYAGKKAGTKNAKGYIAIGISRVIYGGHRLAFLYMTGELPLQEVDHENHIKDDNRWLNIAAATHPENGRNQSLHKHNTSGFMGVSWDKQSSKWAANIQVAGKLKKIGRFKNIQHAVEAHQEAKIKYGYHPNHGTKKMAEEV